MRQKLKFTTLAVFGLIVGAGWSSTESTFSQIAQNQTVAQNRPQVVATSTVICGLTKEIAGNTVDIKCLIDAGSDPHVYNPKPDDRKAIDPTIVKQLTKQNSCFTVAMILNLL